MYVLLRSVHLTWVLFPEGFSGGRTNLRSKLVLNWWWNLWVLELNVLDGIWFNLLLSGWGRKLRLRGAKELTWKGTVRPLLVVNWLGGHGSHHRFSGGRFALLSWRCVNTATLVWTHASLQTPLHYSPGKSKAFYLVVASMETFLWKCTCGRHP